MPFEPLPIHHVYGDAVSYIEHLHMQRSVGGADKGPDIPLCGSYQQSLWHNHDCALHTTKTSADAQWDTSSQAPAQPQHVCSASAAPPLPIGTLTMLMSCPLSDEDDFNDFFVSESSVLTLHQEPQQADMLHSPHPLILSSFPPSAAGHPHHDYYIPPDNSEGFVEEAALNTGANTRSRNSCNLDRAQPRAHLCGSGGSFRVRRRSQSSPGQCPVPFMWVEFPVGPPSRLSRVTRISSFASIRISEPSQTLITIPEVGWLQEPQASSGAGAKDRGMPGQEPDRTRPSSDWVQAMLSAPSPPHKVAGDKLGLPTPTGSSRSQSDGRLGHRSVACGVGLLGIWIRLFTTCTAPKTVEAFEASQEGRGWQESRVPCSAGPENSQSSAAHPVKPSCSTAGGDPCRHTSQSGLQAPSSTQVPTGTVRRRVATAPQLPNYAFPELGVLVEGDPEPGIEGEGGGHTQQSRSALPGECGDDVRRNMCEAEHQSIVCLNQ